MHRERDVTRSCNTDEAVATECVGVRRETAGDRRKRGKKKGKKSKARTTGHAAPGREGAELQQHVFFEHKATQVLSRESTRIVDPAASSNFDPRQATAHSRVGPISPAETMDAAQALAGTYLDTPRRRVRIRFGAHQGSIPGLAASNRNFIFSGPSSSLDRFVVLGGVNGGGETGEE